MLTGNISDISRRILNQRFFHATSPRWSQSSVSPLNDSNLSSPLIKEVKIRPSGYPLAEWYRDNNIEPTNVGGWYIPDEGDPGYDTFLRRIEETSKENAEIRSRIQAAQAAKKKISS